MQSVVKSRMGSWYRTIASALAASRPFDRGRVVDVLAPDPCPVFHLEGFADVPVLQPGLSFYLDLVRNDRGFAFVKRTHGFWDGLVFLCDVVPELQARVTRGETIDAAFIRQLFSDDNLVKAVEARSGFKNHFDDHFYSELVEDLQSPLAMPSYIEATSFRGYPNSDARPALCPVERLRQVFHAFHSSGRQTHDALVWKQAILDGTYWQFVEAIRERSVLLVGPQHLAPLGQYLSLPHFDHIVIPISGAMLKRREILKQCRLALADLSRRGRPTVVLYQAGFLVFWLIYRLFPSAPRSIHLDLGRCLDVWFPEIIEHQPWFVQNSQAIITNMHLEAIYRRFD